MKKDQAVVHNQCDFFEETNIQILETNVVHAELFIFTIPNG